MIDRILSEFDPERLRALLLFHPEAPMLFSTCLLYTSDAADD